MNAQEMKESAERVARGAGYMDEHYPGWERKVNLEILDISDSNACICGQVVRVPFGSNGWFSVSDDIHRSTGSSSYDYGFANPQDGDAWVALIKERFDTGALSDQDGSLFHYTVNGRNE